MSSVDTNKPRLLTKYNDEVVGALKTELGLDNVMAVPKIVINRKHSFEGAYPPDRFIDEVIKGIS